MPRAVTYFPSPADWRDITIYQIFTDRFADGDSSNNELTPSAKYEPHEPRGIHGGDFRGIQSHLDHICGLGARAIWITPVLLNEAGTAWHGYGAVDFATISPQLGGLKGLRRLIRAAHARGIYVLLDVVVNHTGDVVMSRDPGWPRYQRQGQGFQLRWRDSKVIPPAPFNNLNWYHNRGQIETWDDPLESVIGQFHTLSDLRTELPQVRQALTDVYRRLIRDTDCDGFRVDTVKHVERSFWTSWCTSMRQFAASLGKQNFLMFGEVMDHRESKLAEFMGPEQQKERSFDSLLDYPFYFAMNGVIARANAPTRRLTEHWNHLQVPPYSNEESAQLVTFIDNHDVPRFLARENARGDIARLRQALVLLYTSPGIPCLYYGTEQGFSGGGDPYNREDMIVKTPGGDVAASHFNSGNPLYQFIARLNALRRGVPALRNGECKIIADDPNGPGVFAYVRRSEASIAMVVLNTAAESRMFRARRIPFFPRCFLESALEPLPPLRVGVERNLASMRIPAKAAWMFLHRAK